MTWLRPLLAQRWFPSLPTSRSSAEGASVGTDYQAGTVSCPRPRGHRWLGSRTSRRPGVFSVQGSPPRSCVLQGRVQSSPGATSLLFPWHIGGWCLAQSKERLPLSPSEASHAEFGPALNEPLGAPHAEDPVPSLLRSSSAARGSVHFSQHSGPSATSLSTRSLP